MEEKTIKLLMLIPIYIFIVVLLFVAYNQYQLQKKIGDNPCWACGMYKGKSCTQVWPDQTTKDSPELMKSWLTNLANNNSVNEKTTDYSYLLPKK
jgi:hypothetical protein